MYTFLLNKYQLIYERIYTLYLSRYKKFNTLAFLSDPSILNKRIRFSSLHNFISPASSIFDREEIASPFSRKSILLILGWD